MKPDGHSITKSLITEPAREAVMEEASALVSSMTNADRQGPTLLLDVVDLNQARFVKRYCAWLSRGLVADCVIAARFDRSFQRLRRLGGKSKPVQHSNDKPAHWDGPAPTINSIHAELLKWSSDTRLTPEERHVLQICVNECAVRLAAL